MNSIRYGNFAFFAFFLYFVLVTVSFATTTEESRQIVVFFRSLAVVICFFIISYLLIKNSRLSLGLLMSILLLMIIVCWGLLLSIINGSFHMGIQGLLVNIIIIIVGMVVFDLYYKSPSYQKDKITKYVISYSVIVMLGIFLTGGFYFGYPPHFVLSYHTNLSNEGEILYSQGLSKLFGMASLTTFVLWYTKDKMFFNFWFFLAIFFLMLSMIGGARGDSMLAAMVIAGGILMRNVWLFLLFVIITVLCYFLLDFSWANDFLLFERFSVLLEGNLGKRDILFLQALWLIEEQPRCLLMGCGLGYFQIYYDYPHGMYPHNTILEAIISIGLPLTLLIGLLVFFGLMEFLKTEHEMKGFVVINYIYLFLINMKSGDLLSDWFFLSATLFFVSLSIENKLKSFAMSVRKTV